MDVFRFPTNSSLFCAIVGVGTQFFILIMVVFLLSMIGIYYPYNRGALMTSCLVLYAVTAGVGGYVHFLLSSLSLPIRSKK